MKSTGFSDGHLPLLTLLKQEQKQNIINTIYYINDSIQTRKLTFTSGISFLFSHSAKL